MKLEYYKKIANLDDESMWEWSEHLVRHFFIFFYQKIGSFDCMDLGANRGFHVETFSKIVQDNTLIIVEPDSRNIWPLENSIKNLKSKCILYTNPISDRKKEVFFSEDQGNIQLSRVEYPSLITNKQTITIDEISQQYNIKYLKIDIEGEDINAIRGGQETISRCRPIISTEWNNMWDFKDKEWYYNYFYNQSYLLIDLFGDVMDKNFFLYKKPKYWNRFLIPLEFSNLLKDYQNTLDRFYSLYGLNFKLTQI